MAKPVLLHHLPKPGTNQLIYGVSVPEGWTNDLNIGDEVFVECTSNDDSFFGTVRELILSTVVALTRTQVTCKVTVKPSSMAYLRYQDLRFHRGPRKPKAGSNGYHLEGLAHPNLDWVRDGHILCKVHGDTSPTLHTARRIIPANDDIFEGWETSHAESIVQLLVHNTLQKGLPVAFSNLSLSSQHAMQQVEKHLEEVVKDALGI